MSEGLRLTERDRAMLAGELGEACRVAMRMIVAMGTISGARELVDITSAHIDSCLFHGYAGLEFAESLVAGDARVVVPTTLNVGTLDLLHPGLFRGDPETAAAGRRLMDAYVAMGARPTWTCAPYQLAQRPGRGEHIAWAESNAIVFANSVLGARTGRYGDFADIAAALTGRVPLAGLHRTENRRARVLFDVSGVPAALLDEDVCYPLLGHVVGARSGTSVPVIDGLPPALSEDRLKALGAAAASSGAVALFHAVGSTPEAPTLTDALQGGEPERVVSVDAASLRAARDELTTADGRPLVGVSVGTPHFSYREFAALVPLLAGRRSSVDCYVSTSRSVLSQVEAAGWRPALDEFGVEVVVDTCTYITPILRRLDGAVMTNSAKWAYYAPGNLGVEVVFGSLGECVESAVAGRVVRDSALWG